MSPLPTTDLSGFSKLKSRVSGAFDMLQEARSLDFKKAIPWNDIKMGLTKDILAMSNLQDGGILVLGVEEVDGNWELNGISDKVLETYDSDNMHDFVNRYASPPVFFDVVVHTDQNTKKYLILQVHEFEDLPVVCKRDSGELRSGAFYIRPLGKPETREVKSAHEMQNLLELVAVKKTKKILSQTDQIGINLTHTSTGQSDLEQYDEELDGL